MCFQRAGDERLEKLARASELRASAHKAKATGLDVFFWLILEKQRKFFSQSGIPNLLIHELMKWWSMNVLLEEKVNRR